MTTTKKDYVAVDPEECTGHDHYVMIEYAYLMCGCTAVIKVPVDKASDFLK
jgi:hypothetical protein